jgi:O-antigen ligase
VTTGDQARAGLRFTVQPGVLSAARAAVDLDTLVRGILFVAVFLAVWVTFHPFPSLAEPPPELAQTGDRANQIGFSLLFLSLAAWTYCHEPQRLWLLLRPILLATLAWCALSVAVSWDPSLAARRLAFGLVIMSISGMALLLPKNIRHFSDLLTAVALIVLAACYLGLVLAPQLSIHQATDFLEPEHAGDWRGLFPHKNEAGATMVLFIFIGLFVARMRSFVLGGAIVAAAGVFLVFTHSKTALGMLPLVLVLAAIIDHTRRPIFGVMLVAAILVAFNLLSVGSVYFESIHNLLEALIPDATFTGRTDIWRLGLQALAQRPFTGYGFSTFWGTPQVVYGLAGNATWADAATDAHNGYLNLALTIGLPGLALTVAWIVIMPIVDFYRQHGGQYVRPMQMLFLRVCLYGIFASCFESSIFQQVGEVWFFFMTSAFGLRYLSATRAAI